MDQCVHEYNPQILPPNISHSLQGYLYKQNFTLYALEGMKMSISLE